MQALKTRVNKNSPEFKTNYEGMQGLLEALDVKLEESRFQGKEKHIEKARKQDKLLARERIELLLDEDSPFMELLPLAGLGGKGFGPGGTSVGGIGLVKGMLCMVVSNVGTNKGGAVDYATLMKSLRLGEIAMENELPMVNLVESAGANLPEQEKIFNYGGASFRDITRRSKAGIATVAVVFGNATAGGAYVPGMSDYTIFVKEKAKVFLAGPPLVKMATNEVVDDESLGGAEMHSRVSGVSDYLAENEHEAIRMAREVICSLEPSNEKQGIRQPDTEVKGPIYDSEEIMGIVSPDIKKPIEAREIIARFTDGSVFHEFKPEYGTTLVTGWANVHGYRVGIIANNGVLFSESANKGTHFIQLCNMQNTPIIYLQNITGFMVGKEYEEGGIIKDGAKMINAVSNSEVPTITIMIGASYGAGNYAMNGRAYQPRFLFSYPNAKIAVMGPEQLSGVMQSIQREAAHKAGLPYDEEQAEQMRTYLMMEVDKKSNALYATGQLWDDGVIDPRQTRNYLGFCLNVVHNKAFNASNSYGIYRM